MPTAFTPAAQLAGFFVAHGVWNVSDAESGPLIPLVGFGMADGQRKLVRFVSEKMEDGVAQGRTAIESNAEGAVCAVLVYDGFVTLPGDVRRDALIATAILYGKTKRTLEIVVPFRQPSSKEGFAVFRPKFVGATGLENPELQSAGSDFFSGVDLHEQGAAIWNKHLDQSV